MRTLVINYRDKFLFCKNIWGYFCCVLWKIFLFIKLFYFLINSRICKLVIFVSLLNRKSGTDTEHQVEGRLVMRKEKLKGSASERRERRERKIEIFIEISCMCRLRSLWCVPIIFTQVSPARTSISSSFFQPESARKRRARYRHPSSTKAKRGGGEVRRETILAPKCRCDECVFLLLRQKVAF